MRLTGRQLLAGVVSILVLAAIIGGVVMLGSPADERARRLDRRRVSDLEGIETAVNFYHSLRGRLPASLDELSKEQGVRVSGDPATGAPYRYRSTGAEEFELCGTFDLVSAPRVATGVDTWQHPAGEHCFTLKARKTSPR